MQHIKGFYYNFCLRISKLHRQILYANAVFGIDKVFSEQAMQECNLCAVSVVTPTQIVNVPFDSFGYNRLTTGMSAHETVTNEVLAEIYRDYVRATRRGKEPIYFENLINKNVFI